MSGLLKTAGTTFLIVLQSRGQGPKGPKSMGLYTKVFLLLRNFSSGLENNFLTMRKIVGTLFHCINVLKSQGQSSYSCSNLM